MSVQAASWAYKQSVKPPSRRFALIALADFAGEDGRCFPSQATLAKMTGQGERTVRRQLRELEKSGHIRRERRHDARGHRTSDVYQLLAPPERLKPASRPNRPVGPIPTGQIVSSLPARLAREPLREPTVSRETAPGGPPASVKVLFDAGVRLVTETGKAESQARRLVGKWRGQLGDEERMRLLVSAAKATEPIPYIEKIIQKREERRGGYVPMHPGAGG